MKQPYLYYITWGEGETPSILPKELQACEYLESDAQSYISLPNIDGSQMGNVLVKFRGYNPFGYREHNPPGGAYFQLYGGTGGYLYLRWFVTGTGMNLGVGTTTDVELELLANVSPRHINVNGTDITESTTPTYFSGNLALFGMDNRNQGIDYNSIKRLYYFKSNLFDLVACYIKTGETFIDNKGITCQAGTPGMYDVVNNIFYTNDGPGTFTVGPDIIL